MSQSTEVAAGAATSVAAFDAAADQQQMRILQAAMTALVARWATSQGDPDAWLRSVVEIVAAFTKNSYFAGQAQSRAWRTIAIGEDFKPRVTAPYAPNVEQIRKSMLYTGIIAPQIRASRGLTPEIQSSVVLPLLESAPGWGIIAPERTNDVIANAGATMRLVTDAQMQAVEDYANADKVALGFVRVTRPGCCSFCALLAARGAVYSEGSFSNSDAFTGKHQWKDSARVHDGCRCRLRPVYSQADIPAVNQEYAELYKSTPYGKSNKDALRIFRAAYEGREVILG